MKKRRRKHDVEKSNKEFNLLVHQKVRDYLNISTIQRIIIITWIRSGKTCSSIHSRRIKQIK